MRIKWDEQWERQLEREDKKAAREELAMEREGKKELAAERSEAAAELLDSLDSLLAYTLAIDDTIDWDQLKDKTRFSKPYPARAEPPLATRAPMGDDPAYQFKATLPEIFIPSLREKKKAALREKFDSDLKQWEFIQHQNEQTIAYQEEEFKQALARWEHTKQEYETRQTHVNEGIDKKIAEYLAQDAGAVVDYCDIVLENSVYPDCFPKSWDLDYLETSGIVVVDYNLPPPDDMPSLREVKYVQSRDQFDEKYLTQPQQNKLYDSVLYQVGLRTIHELLEADAASAINAVVFNGWVTAIDKATGQEVTGCLLTLQASKEEFQKINLGHVEPKACFKKLKGIGSSKLHGMAPVAPIMRIEREDARFIESSEVAKNIDGSTNIAAMDWQEFEHLVRELFEKEFAVAGGEVRVTRASRDAGVDAIIFDPDPIRGGKIVVQAKRYTNTVGVDAVRDLYGTTINEGATKGILITTSDYGPDAYAFAKDKPMVLLSGNNLLHLLAKHGHTAKIDLKEAKLLLAEEQ